MEQYDILIVGASFAGLTCAHHIDKKYSVLVIDQKTRLDAAIESTGLITTATKNMLEKFIDVKKWIPNAITTIGVVSPDYNKYFFSHTTEPWIYSTDTPNLVKEMSTNLPSHVVFSLSTGLITYTIDSSKEYPVEAEIIKDGVKRVVYAKCIVGADGSISKVASLNNDLGKNTKFLIGFEKVFYGDIFLGEHPEASVYHFWFGEYSLGYGGWLSPTIINGKKAFRVGIAKLEKDKKDLKILDNFIALLQEKGIIKIKPDTKCLVAFGHPIPIGGVVKNFTSDHAILIGDAGGFCGAFAADGIKGSIVSGKIAAQLIGEYLAGDKTALQMLHKKIEQETKLMTYYKKQVLYRFIWDQMKSDAAFHAMYDVIEREKDHFLDQFCDSKDRSKGLLHVVLHVRNIPLLIKYGLYILRDMLFRRNVR